MKVALILLDDYLTVSGKDFADLGEDLLTPLIDDKGNVEFEKFDYFNNHQALPNPADFNLIYLTGSRRDSYHNDEFNLGLISYLQNTLGKVKVLGVCFGHQIIARAIGLRTLKNNEGWEMGVYVIEEGDKSFMINEMHQDIVAYPTFEEMKKLRDMDVKISGRSRKCDVQKMYGMSECLLTFQGHPEFKNDVTMNMINDKFQKGMIDEKFWKDSIKREAEIEDNGILKQTIKQFIS